MSDATAAEEGYVPLLDALAGNLSVRVHLYTNDPALTSGMTESDFDEPVYVGYTYETISTWTPAAMAGASAEAQGGPVYFEYTTGAEPDPIRGVYFTDVATGAFLWAWRKSGSAFALGADLPVLRVTLTLRHPP